MAVRKDWNYHQGNSVDMVFYYQNTAGESIIPAGATFTLRAKETHRDTVLDLEITGSITDASTGEITIPVTGTDNMVGKYVYDVEMLRSDATSKTLLFGTLNFEQNVK